jgi:hypothetical protein
MSSVQAVMVTSFVLELLSQSSRVPARTTDEIDSTQAITSKNLGMRFSPNSRQKLTRTVTIRNVAPERRAGIAPHAVNQPPCSFTPALAAACSTYFWVC